MDRVDYYRDILVVETVAVDSPGRDTVVDSPAVESPDWDIPVAGDTACKDCTG